MMIFMGLLFYKVPSGLCIYFIASSLWGIAERKLIPSATANLATSGGGPSSAGTSSGERSAGGGASAARAQPTETKSGSSRRASQKKNRR
jgi:membrane protein insertase Oxa1/YidC/SpoIIIJ